MGVILRGRDLTGLIDQYSTDSGDMIMYGPLLSALEIRIGGRVSDSGSGSGGSGVKSYISRDLALR